MGTFTYEPESTYGADIGASCWRSVGSPNAAPGTHRHGKSGDWSSLESLLRSDFRARGFTPEVAVLALPGCWKWDEKAQQMRFVFTNLNWDSVTEDELCKALGIRRVMFINDLQAAQYGARFMPEELLLPLKPGRPGNGKRLAVATVSTGFNWATGPSDPNGPLPPEREEGHTRLPYDPNTPVANLVGYLHAQLGIPVSMEHVLGGKRGPGYIADFVLNCLLPNPGPETLDAIDVARPHYAVAPLMTRGAMDGDVFWEAVAGFHSAALGNVLHDLVVGEQVDTVYLQGSVVMGTPHYAKELFSPNSQCEKALLIPGMNMPESVRDVRVLGVPDELDMAAIGAAQYARHRLKAGA